MGGGNGVEGGEGEEREGESEPLVGRRVEGMKGRMRGHVAVGGLEGEEEERDGLGPEEVEERRRGEGGVEGFTDALGGSDLA